MQRLGIACFNFANAYTRLRSDDVLSPKLRLFSHKLREDSPHKIAVSCKILLTDRVHRLGIAQLLVLVEGHETVELVSLFVHIQQNQCTGRVVPVVVVFCSLVV